MRGLQDRRLATPEVAAGEVTVGVEEEFCVVDAATGVLRPDADEILPLAKELLGDQVEAELNRAQVETGTRVCTTLAEVRAELERLRRGLREAAGRAGCSVVSSGTHPTAATDESGINRAKDRYRRLLAHVRPALDDAGDWDEVRALVDRALSGGNGAVRQRAALARRGDIADVLSLLLA